MAEPNTLDFMKFLREFQMVKRAVDIEDRYENDAEHSYQLAMLGWWIDQKLQLGLDHERLLKYALVHDLVEVYAGDLNPLTASAEEWQQKPAKEAAAAEQIQKRFQEFGQLHDTILSYAAKADKESRILYVVDKVLPLMNLYITDKHHDWYRSRDITGTRHADWLAGRFRAVELEGSDVHAIVQEIVEFMMHEGMFTAENAG
jgi:putative hydrolase of HD superfamily